MFPFPIIPPVSRFITLGVEFDGSNDYMTRGAGLTGAADGPFGVISFWIRPDNITSKVLFTDGGTGYVAVVWSAADKLNFQLYETGGAKSFDVLMDDAFPEDGLWHHVMANWNTNAAAGAKTFNLYVDGVTKAVTKTDTSDPFSVDYTSTNWAIGATAAGASKIQAGLAQFYFATESFDLTSAANRAKFYSGGKPVDLGPAGALPTGTAPIVFQVVNKGGAAADFAPNAGTGGDFAITGTLTLSATNPGD